MHDDPRVSPANDVSGDPGTADPAPTAEEPLSAPGPAGPEQAAPEPRPADPGRRAPSPGCLILSTVVIAAVVGALSGLGGFAVAQWMARPASVRVVEGVTDEPVAAAAAAALPSVVNLDVEDRPNGGDSSLLPTGHPDIPMQSQGSGVAYKSAPGGGTYVITNEHVVVDAAKVVVTLPGGSPADATVVGTDADTDIAVVRVKEKIPLIGVADSSKLVVGQTVVAIGSPFGLERSVSSGVVSGLHRSLPDSSDADKGFYPLVDVIQTDAAINPGNSGGPLVDTQGRLVGVNAAIYSDSGESAGVGFAIPSNTVRRIADELIGGGKTTHPYLGIIGETLTAAEAKNRKLDITSGALVVDLTPGSGAAKAGIEKGDVVVTFEGKPVRSMDDLMLFVRGVRVGQSVTLGIVRDGRERPVEVRVGDKPAPAS